jgi:hypothetical protein
MLFSLCTSQEVVDRDRLVVVDVLLLSENGLFRLLDDPVDTMFFSTTQIL